MTTITLIAEDMPDGTIRTSFKSSRPLPEKPEDFTLAELFAVDLANWIKEESERT